MVLDNLKSNKTNKAERLKNLLEWRYNYEMLWKEFKFKDFDSALNFIKSLSPYFEKSQCYPEIYIFNNRVLFEFQNLSEDDDKIIINFESAQEIEKGFKCLDILFK